MLRSFAVWVSLAVPAMAGLVRIEVRERSDVLEGRSFGRTGAYERVVGKAYFTVDPALAANRIITDIALAPRNAQGLVEFSADLYMLQPRDPARGNGAVLYEVSNRGGKGMLGTFNRASGSRDPRTAAEFGDGLLMEQGYTLLWLGWQFDVPRDPALMRLYTPVVTGVTGLVRSEITLDRKETRASVADRNHVPYPVLNPADPKLVLTVRDRAEGQRRAIPRARWSIENGSEIVLPAAFEPGRIYELVYTAQDPPVAGLGPAAVRDAISYLKSKGIQRAYGFGVSQSGRFLRTFVYYGFNRDEQGHKVFDGILAHVAGAGRGSFNIRFAQPSRDGHPHFNTLYPTDIFPFTDLDETDPKTGLTDGILHRAGDAVPKIFHTNSSYEYYGRAASLIHTSLDARRDAEIPETTRIYLFAGGQHGPAGFPPRRGQARNLPNPNAFTYSLRALLLAMDAWVRDGKQPPPSQYPRLDRDQLVPLDAVAFPKIPGVDFPTRIQHAWRADYGPQFRSAGIITFEPPRLNGFFPTLVPQVDADGNETSGVRMPDVQWPLATYTGWNLRTPAVGAPDEIFSMVGSWLPFPRTKADRERTKDPRLSIEERYATRDEYLQRIGAAARSLADRGFLLDRDVAALMERGAAVWDAVAK